MWCCTSLRGGSWCVGGRGWLHVCWVDVVYVSCVVALSSCRDCSNVILGEQLSRPRRASHALLLYMHTSSPTTLYLERHKSHVAKFNSGDAEKHTHAPFADQDTVKNNFLLYIGFRRTVRVPAVHKGRRRQRRITTTIRDEHLQPLSTTRTIKNHSTINTSQHNLLRANFLYIPIVSLSHPSPVLRLSTAASAHRLFGTYL